MPIKYLDIKHFVSGWKIKSQAFKKLVGNLYVYKVVQLSLGMLIFRDFYLTNSTTFFWGKLDFVATDP